MQNAVHLCGRMVATPELKATENGTTVTSFTIAVDRNTKDKQADFINCVAWRSRAEFIARNFPKGKMIIIGGRLQSRSYSTQNGEKRFVTEVVVNEAYFAGDKPKTADNEPSAVASGSFSELEDADGEVPF